MYDITSNINIPTCSVDNEFVRNLYSVVNNCINNAEYPCFCFDNQKSKYNLCNLQSFISDNAPNLFTSVANYRYKQHGGTDTNLSYASKKTLFIDYLLKTCICYVEIYKGNFPQKFYATRNVDLLQKLSLVDPEDVSIGRYAIPTTKDLRDTLVYNKALACCTPLTQDNIIHGEMKMLRFERKKGGFSVTFPRNYMSIGSSEIRITPIFINFMIMDNLVNKLKTGVYEITYYKDNMAERKLVSSLNLEYITKIYDNNREKAHSIIANSNMNNIHRGYMTLPELLLPISDETGCRAVSFRIKSVTPIDITTFKNPYLYIDLDAVVELFYSYLETYKGNQMMMYHVYTTLEKSIGRLRGKEQQEVETFMLNAQKLTAEQMYNNMMSWVSTCQLLNKTQTCRDLHLFMVSNPMLFQRYTGKRMVISGGIDWTEGI